MEVSEQKKYPTFKERKKYWNFFFELVVEVTKNLGFILKKRF